MQASPTQLDIHQLLDINATPDKVFDAVVHRFTVGNTGGENQPMPMILEQWPGGRWYRDLGNNNGHLWGHVQSIKKPNLIEFYGQLFMSFPASNHIIIRISANGDGSKLDFRHQCFGLIDPAYVDGLEEGWAEYLTSVREDCE